MTESISRLLLVCKRSIPSACQLPPPQDAQGSGSTIWLLGIHFISRLTTYKLPIIATENRSYSTESKTFERAHQNPRARGALQQKQLLPLPQSKISETFLFLKLIGSWEIRIFQDQSLWAKIVVPTFLSLKFGPKLLTQQKLLCQNF